MTRTIAALQMSCLGFLIVAGVLRAKMPAPGIPAEGKADPVPTVSENVLIPRDVLIGMYRAELGERFHDADADKIYAAHQVLETFFDASSVAQRKQIIQSLEQTGVAPEI